MNTLFTRLQKYVPENKFVLISFVVILISFFINTWHTQFPDEFDNIYGGLLINQGALPYTGFFTHHNPGAYFLAAIITLFTGRSFVLFRITFSFMLFVWFLFSYYLIKKRLPNVPLSYFLVYGIVIGFGATYWWGQMILSETIVGHLLVPAVILIIEKSIHKIKFDLKDVLIISLLTFFSIFVSLTYIYLVPIILFVTLYLYFRSQKKIVSLKSLTPFLIILAPYLVFILYLIVTGSVNEFRFAAFTYNIKYYIYNFPKVGDVYSRNPARYALSIVKNNLDQMYTILTMVKNFNLSYPMNTALGLSVIGNLIYFLTKKKYTLSFFLVSLYFFTNARSEPLNVKETDFHSTVFIMCAIVLAMWLLSRLKVELSHSIDAYRKTIYSSLLLLVGLYWVFNSFYLFQQFADKAYGKFMGRDPLIYDNSQVAPTLNKIVSENEYYWIGPFELQELLFIKGKIASKYFWFLPASSRDPKITGELIADLETHKPKVIVFKKWWANFGVQPEDFNGVIVNFLNQNYFQIADLRRERLKVKVIAPYELNFDFEKEYFFDKSRKTQIIKQLVDEKLIEIQ